MFVKEIILPIYNVPFDVVFIQYRNEFRELYAADRGFKDKVEDAPTEYTAGFYHSVAINSRIRRHCIVFTLLDCNVEPIVHEVFHLIVEMFRDIGLDFTYKGQEAYAYAIGWVTNQVFLAYKEAVKASYTDIVNTFNQGVDFNKFYRQAYEECSDISEYDSKLFEILNNYRLSNPQDFTDVEQSKYQSLVSNAIQLILDFDNGLPNVLAILKNLNDTNVAEISDKFANILIESYAANADIELPKSDIENV